MFAMFSLRRPDILPVGDLGVQRGLLYWALSSHAPKQYPLHLNPRKLPKTGEDDVETVKPETAHIEIAESTSIPPAPATPKPRSKLLGDPPVELLLQVIPVNSTPKTPARASGSKQPGKTATGRQSDEKIISLIPPAPVTLPKGINLEELISRANGKKVKGGNYLLPSEMEALTKPWAPYRSLGASKTIRPCSRLTILVGVFYLWSIMDSK